MDKRAKISISVIATQVAITCVIAVATLFFADHQTVLAVVAGGTIGVLATALFSLRVFAGRLEWSAQRFLQRFYRAEMQKLGLIAILLFCAIKWIGLPALPLVLVCVAVLMASWIALLFKI